MHCCPSSVPCRYFLRPLLLYSASSYNAPPCEARMSPRIPTALILSIVYLSTPAWADFQTGMEAYNSGDYATALREWRPLAELGDSTAQAALGLLYEKGRGV